MSDSQVPDTIATTLNESEEGPKQRIAEIVEVLGDSLALSLLQETQRIEDAGGELTANGKRRRTPGGIFFKLAKKQLSGEDRKRIFRPPPKPAEEEGSADAPPAPAAVAAAPIAEQAPRPIAPAPPPQEPVRAPAPAPPPPPRQEPIRVRPIAGPVPRPMHRSHDHQPMHRSHDHQPMHRGHDHQPMHHRGHEPTRKPQVQRVPETIVLRRRRIVDSRSADLADAPAVDTAVQRDRIEAPVEQKPPPPPAVEPPKPARPRVLVKLPTATPDPIPAKNREEAIDRIRKVLTELNVGEAQRALMESLIERLPAVDDRRAPLEKLVSEYLPPPPEPEPEPEPEPPPPPEDPAVRRERTLIAVAEGLNLPNKDLAVSLYGDGSPPACRKAAAARKRYRNRLESQPDGD